MPVHLFVIVQPKSIMFHFFHRTLIGSDKNIEVNNSICFSADLLHVNVSELCNYSVRLQKVLWQCPGVLHLPSSLAFFF